MIAFLNLLYKLLQVDPLQAVAQPVESRFCSQGKPEEGVLQVGTELTDPGRSS